MDPGYGLVLSLQVCPATLCSSWQGPCWSQRLQMTCRLCKQSVLLHMH